MYAVIKTGGKQYKVSPGDIIVVEKLLAKAGAKVKFDKVLVVGEEGKNPEVGMPLIVSAAVNCEVMEQSRAAKIIVYKKKRRQGYERKKGHRQDQTVLRVLDINGKGALKVSAKKKASVKTAVPKSDVKPEEKSRIDKPKVKVAKVRAPEGKGAMGVESKVKKKSAPAKKAAVKKKGE
jgi:large subunit ribosomal protein L21